MGLSADHIPKLGLSVGQPVMVVKKGEHKPGRFRSYMAGSVYVEHDKPSDRPTDLGRPDIEHVTYRCEDLDDLYPIRKKLPEDVILRWLTDEDLVDRAFIREAMRRRYGGE